MKKIKRIDGIKLEDGDVLDIGFSEYYASYLKKNPKKLKNLKNTLNLSITKQRILLFF